MGSNAYVRGHFGRALRTRDFQPLLDVPILRFWEILLPECAAMPAHMDTSGKWKRMEECPITNNQYFSITYPPGEHSEFKSYPITFQ